MHSSLEELTYQNQKLSQEIKKLNRTIADKDNEMDRLSNEVNHLTFMQQKQNSMKRGQTEELPNTNFFAQDIYLADKNRENESKIRMLIKLTLKFL